MSDRCYLTSASSPLVFTAVTAALMASGHSLVGDLMSLPISSDQLLEAEEWLGTIDAEAAVDSWLSSRPPECDTGLIPGPEEAFHVGRRDAPSTVAFVMYGALTGDM